ncbi:GDSL-type esterase/lipase family protein [Roseiterribacter gracilis]|uniref:Lipase n=1 Tax=Roseiterribacter gracilis TaxID=2812848 RepID=A0A8S8X5X4_9PROT|nr:lipase [Rhodospirillales bacterium TMPK1]
MRSATRAGLASLLLLGLTNIANAAPEDRRKLDEFKRIVARDDVAELDRYRADNRTLLASSDARPRIVLLGDSILFHWTDDKLPAPAKLNLINRGIPGQNTTQMLLRFEDDVVALAPKTVVLMGGTNDLRVYEGEPAAARDDVVARATRNLTAMADIAQAQGIKVILCTVPPFGSDPKLQRDLGTVLALNDWIRSFAKARTYPVADTFMSLADPAGYLPVELAPDGLHPNDEGYRRMWRRLETALKS